MKYQHKTMWTWVGKSGAVIYFHKREDAVSYALEHAGLKIVPPLYADI